MNITANSLAVADTSVASVNLPFGSTVSIPLPDNQTLTTFTANGDNTAFTVPNTGLYYISYFVSITQDLVLSSALTQNGTIIPASVTVSPVNTHNYTATIVSFLNAGDEISIIFYGSESGTITFAGGIGASLVMIQLN